MNHSSRTSQRGFSLVELMVVVAIIGVLASIAIPNIQKYIAKARQTEAKTNLATLYTAEKAFYAEYTAYHAMFGAIGYSPEGKLRYNVGFTSAQNADGNNGYMNAPTSALGQSMTTLAYCNTNGGGAAGVIQSVSTGGAGCVVLNGATNATAPNPPAAALTRTTFTAGAAAKITTNNLGSDSWTIDENKSLLNTVPEIQ